MPCIGGQARACSWDLAQCIALTCGPPRTALPVAARTSVACMGASTLWLGPAQSSSCLAGFCVARMQHHRGINPGPQKHTAASARRAFPCMHAPTSSMELDSHLLMPCPLVFFEDHPPSGCMQVPGCTSDLSIERIYCRVRLICSAHVYTPLIRINGRNLRWCQQCAK